MAEAEKTTVVGETADETLGDVLASLRIDLEDEIARLRKELHEDMLPSSEALVRAQLSGLEYALAKVCDQYKVL